jgi:hypothetical protein
MTVAFQILAGFLWAQTPVPPQGGILLDAVAAVVDREVITRSDVERTARVSLARQGGRVAAARVELDHRLETAVLQQLVVEELVLLDARREQTYPETDQDVLIGAARIKSQFSSEGEFLEFLQAAQIPEADFMEMMRREARVGRRVAEHMDATPPTEAEVRQVVAEKAELRALPPKVAAEQARQYLLHMKQGESAATYVERLRERAHVRVVAKYGATLPAPPPRSHVP